MKKDITLWKENTLLPKVFQNINSALPEFKFEKIGDNWRSSTRLKITGEDGSEKGKVFIYANNIEYLKDWREGSIPIVDYIMRREGIVEPLEAIKELASRVGLELPENGDFDREAHEKAKVKANILEDANNYFIDSLKNSPEAKEMRAYLANRGYTPEDIEFMELGFIPSQRELSKHLQSKKHTLEEIRENIHLNEKIGSTHSLTIPYRSGKYVTGFVVRTIGDYKPKYIVSTGLKRDTLFNLSNIKGDKDIVIVEGYLDALIATARGVENVVGLGGTSSTVEAYRDAIRRGAKKFTLCLDTDPSGKKGTLQAIELLLKENFERIYVVTLPDTESKIDPDTLIKEKGVEAFQNVLDNSIAYYYYKLEDIYSKHGIGKGENKELNHKEVDSFLEDIVEGSLSIKNPFHKKLYSTAFTENPSIKALGITPEDLALIVDRIEDNIEEEKLQNRVKKLTTTASKLLQEGGSPDAIDYLTEEIKAIRIRSQKRAFSKLLEPITMEEVKERARNKPESLYTGYDLQEPLYLPSGALSFFVAPTGHGKTTLMLNMALNIAQDNPELETHFFSFEEDTDSLLMKSLNIYLGRNLEEPIHDSNPRNQIIKYFATGDTYNIRNPKSFKALSSKFFKELVSTNRFNIHGEDYNNRTLCDAIRFINKTRKVGAIFIDYIQLIPLLQNRERKTYSRQEEVKAICQDLLEVAKETGLPIVLGAQFNRDVKNPLLLHTSYLGEAGDIERIASLIVAFWNNTEKIEHNSVKSNGILLQQMDEKGLIRYDPEEDLKENPIIEDRYKTLFVKMLKNRGGNPKQKGNFSWDGATGAIERIKPSKALNYKESSFSPEDNSTGGESSRYGGGTKQEILPF